MRMPLNGLMIYTIAMMRNFLAGWVCVAWGLWLGGLGALFLFVTRLFQTDHDLGAQAAPVLFLNFEKYQLLVAMALLVGMALWRIAAGTRRLAILFWIFGAVSVAAALEPIGVTRRLEALRLAGQTASPEFQKWHQVAGVVYSGETLLLLAAGFLLPGAIRSNKDPRASATVN
jgi:hypothetical protein